MSLSPRVRFEILSRDNFTCQYCGAEPPDVVLQVDHIIAVSNGGSDDWGNLITSCSDCNLGKSNLRLEDAGKMSPQQKRLLKAVDQAHWKAVGKRTMEEIFIESGSGELIEEEEDEAEALREAALEDEYLSSREEEGD